MNLLEKEICTKIKMGDEKAFEYIFKSYYSSLYAYAFDLVKNNHLAEEVVQETLIKVWENRIKLDINISLKAYLYRCIHNQCINILKHLYTMRNQEEKYSEDTKNNAELMMLYGESFELDSFFYDGFEEDIKKAIQLLPEQCRIIFRMSRFENMNYNEIALKLNISLNTVKKQISRALDKLRTYILSRISDRTKILN